MSRLYRSIGEIVRTLEDRIDCDVLVDFERDQIRFYKGAELKAAVIQIYRLLSGHGVSPGDRVMLFSPNGVMWIASCLAVFARGCIIVPVDWQLDSEAFAHVLSDCEPVVVLTTQSGVDRMRALTSDFNTPSVIITQFNAERELASKPLPEPVGFPDGVAALFYTSGTTGFPKGVPLTEDNLLYQINCVIQTGIVNQKDRVLMPLPLHHIYPFSIGMMCPLAIGIPIIFPEELTGPALLRAARHGQATVMIGVPRLYSAILAGIENRMKAAGTIKLAAFNGLMAISALIRKCGGPLVGRLLFKRLHANIGPSLRLFTTGGASLEPNVASRLESLGWSFAIGYGLTETSPLLALKLDSEPQMASVGKPLPATEIRIEPLSDKMSRETTGELVEDRIHSWQSDEARGMKTVGEIVARGPGIFAGYRNLPEQTASVFSEGGWFHTGDLGYLKKGRLYVLGRASSLIVTESGKKIDPEILEKHYIQNPLISEIGILGHLGKLVAVVVPSVEEAKHRHADLDRIIHDAIDERSLQLPTYKRLAGYILSNRSLPRTPMGKLKRHNLAVLYDKLRKGAGRKEPAGALTEPDNLDEELLKNPVVLKVWQYFRKRYQAAVPNMEASLRLDLGIDSLEWIDLTLELEQETGLRLRQDVVANFSTVRDLLMEIAVQQSTGIVENPQTKQTLDALSDADLRWIEPLTARESLETAVLHLLILIIMKLLFRVRSEGAENIPEDENVVFVPNHSSFLDPFALGAAMPRRVLQKTYWAGWIGIAFANALARRLSRLGQVIPIDADHALISSIALGGSVIRHGKNLVWFPEGRRTLTGDLLTFKPGIGLLMQHFPVRAVPVYIDGTAKALPPGSSMLRPHRITVVFGKPVSVDELNGHSEELAVQTKIATSLKARVQMLREEFAAQHGKQLEQQLHFTPKP